MRKKVKEVELRHRELEHELQLQLKEHSEREREHELKLAHVATVKELEVLRINNEQERECRAHELELKRI